MTFTKWLLAITLICSPYLFMPTLQADDSDALPTTNTAVELTATFAGGCFWCMQKPFDQVNGVSKTIVGFTGGHISSPSYKQVSAGGTGHLEVVQVYYQPNVVSYEQLLRIFWRNIDPFDGGGQFCDRGSEYSTAIFVNDEEQQMAAEHSRQTLLDSALFKQTIVTPILAAKTFYPAEDYHQNYYEKNPLRYKFYRYNCGRDTRLTEIWKNIELPY